MKKIIIIFACLTLLWTASFLAAPVVNAQDFDPEAFQVTYFYYSTKEKVGFAFYKLSGIKPNFQAWVDSNRKIKKMTPLQYLIKRKTELDRYEIGFIHFDPEVNFIEIKADIALTAMSSEEIAKTEERYLQVHIGTESQWLYFPFHYANPHKDDLWVAFVPKEMDMIRKISLNQKEYARICKKLGIGPDNRNGAGLIRILIKAESVDKAGPVELDGIEMWMMQGQAATVGIMHAESDFAVWKYVAPWYKRRMNQELQILKIN